jgi:Domain of unknown function (DUF1707)
MDDRMRVSDADRDHVTARLRDHFAQGRLTPGELDERLSAALNAKTVGDLRRVMADLPEPAAVTPRAAHRARRAGPPPWVAHHHHHRPRLLPVLLLVLFAMLVVPSGGWVLFAFLRIALLVWLVTCLARVVVGLFHRRTHRYW